MTPLRIYDFSQYTGCAIADGQCDDCAARSLCWKVLQEVGGHSSMGPVRGLLGLNLVDPICRAVWRESNK
jgi:hypothetical protein